MTVFFGESNWFGLLALGAAGVLGWFACRVRRSIRKIDSLIEEVRKQQEEIEKQQEEGLPHRIPKKSRTMWGDD